MTTKRARSRRLVQSTDAEPKYYFGQSAKRDEKSTYVREPFYPQEHGKYQEQSAVLWDGDQLDCIIRTRTRLALHNAILRAGWPSPWHEVGTTLTAPFVADMQAAGWTTKLDTVFREGECAGTAETTHDGVHMTAKVWRDMILIRCRVDEYTGPIGYRTAYVMTEWVNLGACAGTAETARNFRQSRPTFGSFGWAPNLVPFPFHEASK